MNQMIEHFTNPVVALEAIHRKLSPGGRLLIETPNLGGFDFYLFQQKYWGHWHIPRHLHLFTQTSLIRSDNGLVYQSRWFRAACRDYRLQQEFITPYLPEQNGIIERFFRSLKEEWVWQHLFPSFTAARREIAAWIRWYNEARPHLALGYRSQDLPPRNWTSSDLRS